MKKHLIWLCMLMILFLAFGCPGADAEGGSGYTYRVRSDGTAVITGYTGSDTQLTIPAELGGAPVTEIGEYAFFNCRKVTNITIPDSIEIIGAFAFQDCRALRRIEIPGSVRTIPYCAFNGCEKLKTVTIGEGTERIEAEAFSCCIQLTDVTIPESVTAIGQNAFFSCEALNAVRIPSRAMLEGNPFSSCSRLTRITFGGDNPAYVLRDGVLFSRDGETLICYPAALKSREYTVPKGTREIGGYAFGGCRNLKNIIIPDSVTEIGQGAFKRTAVPTVTIGGKRLSRVSALYTDCPEDGETAKEAVFREARYQAQNGSVIDYYLYLPDAAQNAGKLPILIYFHGVRDTIERHHGIGELLRTGQIHPKGIVILPQAVNESTDADFHTKRYQDAVIELAGQIAAAYNGDLDRLSVSGHSDGGVTAYQIVNNHPGVFAACAPISGIGNMGEGIRQTWLWVFQGARDQWVKPGDGLRVAVKCEQAGCNAQHYIYAGEGHDIQTMVFLDTFTDENGRKVRLIDWLMSKTLTQ